MVACVVTLAVIALVCIWITNFHLHIGLRLEKASRERQRSGAQEYLRIQLYSKNIIKN